MDLALCKHAYQPAIERHAARLFPYFRRIPLKIISLNESYLLVADATLESIKFKYPFKRTTRQTVQRILSVYEIGDAEICLPFNRIVVASIISELLINYTQDFGV